MVAAEYLDTLNPNHPLAIGSRGDLRRINRIMGHASFLMRLFLETSAPAWVKSIVEWGAGDGNISEAVATKWPRNRPPPTLILVDQHALVPDARRQRIQNLGWTVQTVTTDVFAWLETGPQPEGRLIFANLFLHHFSNELLAQLLEGAAKHCQMFAACEPRRSRAALLGASLLGLIGCNAVTRHDAVVSVRAGFRDREISALCKATNRRETQEGSTGLFSHYFLSREPGMASAPNRRPQ